MKSGTMILCAGLLAARVLADDAPRPAIVDASVSASSKPNQPGGSATSDEPQAARFLTEAKWGIAGYNNNEIVYTIVLTSQDSRILRCTTELKGWYFEDGKKLSIADRQSSTVFPDQQVQVGNWMGMDEKSGATYSVKCRPI